MPEPKGGGPSPSGPPPKYATERLQCEQCARCKNGDKQLQTSTCALTGIKIWRKPHKRTVPLSVAGAGTTSPSDNVALAEAYLRTKWYPNPSSRLATIYRKVGVVCPSTPRHESSSILRKFVCRTLRQIRSVRLCSRTLRLCRASKSRDKIAGVTSALRLTPRRRVPMG